MPDSALNSDAKTLFFIPSFYGALTWGAWLILYAMELVRLDECTYSALLLYLFVELVFLLAVAHSLPRYRLCLDIRQSSTVSFQQKQPLGTTHKVLLVGLHLIGYFGIAKYILDFSRAMGGIWWFMFALMNEAVKIRAEAEFSRSIGTQIAYAGWIAIALTMYWIAGKKLSKWWLIPVIVQFAGNLTYLDRTKPVTILLTSLFIMLPSVMRQISVRKILVWVSSAICVTILTFWAVAEWLGKTYYKWADETAALPGITYDIYTYGVSGFGYFNKLLEINQPASYFPERVLYPLLKFTAKFELTREPPSQILEFLYIPFSTNIGTFLEPFYSDGGMAFTIVGVFLFSFGLNSAGLYFLRANTAFADYAWANICLSLTLAFIFNKMVTFPFWLFCGTGIISAMITNQNAAFERLKSASAFTTGCKNHRDNEIA